MTAQPTLAAAPVATAPAVTSSRRTLIRLLGIGALLGVAWSSSLCAYMVQLAGPDSKFTWLGTFLGLLLPSAAVGALLGWAEHLRRNGGRHGWRWLALSPLLFAIAALCLPGAITTLVTTGQGSGAIGMTLLGMLGGVTPSGRGPLWLRIPCGVIAFALVPAAYLGPPMRPKLDPATPHGAWVATHFSAQFVMLAIACTIPLRNLALVRRRVSTAS